MILVHEVRSEELDNFKQFGVSYVKVSLSESWAKTPLKTRWVDVNEGDDKLEVRSRFVAKKIKMDKREDLFATTPPLEAMNMLFIFSANTRHWMG